MRTLLVALVTLALACGGKAKPPAAQAAEDDPHSCPEGMFLGEDDGCMKRCQSAADCDATQTCEDIRTVAFDGTKGPVTDRGCM